jgi:hypothetical protein
MVVPCNGGFLFVFLLKALSGDWIFSEVKSPVLTMLVRPGNGGVDALIPLWRRRFGESSSKLS